MSDSAETSAFRESFAQLLARSRTSTVYDGVWVDDWPALAELGLTSVLDPDLDEGTESVRVAVAAAEELARARCTVFRHTPCCLPAY